jgi:hypothetical protein
MRKLAIYSPRACRNLWSWADISPRIICTLCAHTNVHRSYMHVSWLRNRTIFVRVHNCTRLEQEWYQFVQTSYNCLYRVCTTLYKQCPRNVHTLRLLVVQVWCKMHTYNEQLMHKFVKRTYDQNRRVVRLWCNKEKERVTFTRRAPCNRCKIPVANFVLRIGHFRFDTRTQHGCKVLFSTWTSDIR